MQNFVTIYFNSTVTVVEIVLDNIIFKNKQGINVNCAGIVLYRKYIRQAKGVYFKHFTVTFCNSINNLKLLQEKISFKNKYRKTYYIYIYSTLV